MKIAWMKYELTYQWLGVCGEILYALTGLPIGRIMVFNVEANSAMLNRLTDLVISCRVAEVKFDHII